jgi:uncharacterized membrane protein
VAQSFLDWLVVGLRWLHIVAILGWVGASLYFMWLESKLRLPVPARENVLGEAWMGHGGGFYIVQKRSIAPGQVPSPVYWFRVEAGITWVTGFLLLVFVYYWNGGVDLVDPQAAAISPKAAIGLAIALLVLAWIVYDRLWVSKLAEDKVAIANVVSLILLFAVVYLLCKLFTGRAAFIHVGSILGTNMVANVWTRIIPAQEEAVAATTAGRQRNAVLGTRARRRAIHNTYLTLPVIFTMIAMHAPGTYSHPLNWLLLSLLIVVGMAARHLMILFDRREPATGTWASAGAPLAASVVALGFLSAPRSEPAPTGGQVPFTVVRGIVDLRCGSCHSRRPTDKAFVAAPDGVGFDTAGEIAARAPMIKASSVVGRTMPPANSTRMTDEERALIGRWVDGGARIDSTARQ